MKFEDVVRKLTGEKNSNSGYVSRGRPKRSWIGREGMKVNIIDNISTTEQNGLEMFVSNCILAFDRGSRSPYKKEERGKCANCGRDSKKKIGRAHV